MKSTDYEKQQIADAKQKLSESAFDFLERSVKEIEEHPKYSVIHFATAVELILKARLMDEHWSLVVDRFSKADQKIFLRGDCRSVGLTEAIKRLRSDCKQNIPHDAAAQFQKLSAHRNRMIHFFHEAGSEEAPTYLVVEIAKEQYKCWYYLKNLIKQWRDQFDAFDHHINRINSVLRSNQSFLSDAFDLLKPEIEEDRRNGMTFHSCLGCGYEAVGVNVLSSVLYEQSCRCCGLIEEWYAEIKCPVLCGSTVRIAAEYGGDRTCPKCDYELTPSDLDEALNTECIDPTDFDTVMNCALCRTSGSVVQHHKIYVCTECLANSSETAGCDWCGGMQMGGDDIEGSFYFGCEFCDGKVGQNYND